MEFRTLRPDEMDAWVTHCAQVFSSDTPDYFRAHFDNDPFADRDGIFVALDGARIVSTVRVFTREVYLRGQRVSMGGIGEVSTQPDYRKRGLSSRLLAMAEDYMRGHDMKVSVLFSGNNRHYASSGYHTMVSRALDIAYAPAPLPEGYTLRALEDADLPTVRGIYSLYSQGLDGALVREHPDYWTRWVRAEWQNSRLLVMNGRGVAYIDYGRGTRGDKHVIYLREFGALPGHAHMLLPMLRALALSEPLPAFISLSGVLTQERGHPREDMGTMVKLICPFPLDGQWIRTATDLKRVYADPLFWDTDGF